MSPKNLGIVREPVGRAVENPNRSLQAFVAPPAGADREGADARAPGRFDISGDVTEHVNVLGR